MCMKKVYRYQLNDGTAVETVSRNCAQQKFTEQVIIETCWARCFDFYCLPFLEAH